MKFEVWEKPNRFDVGQPARIVVEASHAHDAACAFVKQRVWQPRADVITATDETYVCVHRPNRCFHQTFRVTARVTNNYHAEQITDA